MKHIFLRLFITVLLLIFSFNLFANLNQLRITEDAERMNRHIVPADITDVNNRQAACIIFKTDLDTNVQFQAHVQTIRVTNPAYGEYFVYVQPGERSIIINAAGFEPLSVLLRDYGINNLRSGEVYQLKFTGSRSVRATDADLFTVQFNLEPADLYISANAGAPILVNGNQTQFRLPSGNHQFTFIKQGFREETINLNVTENTVRVVRLQAGATQTTLNMPGFLVIDSQPKGAQLYLNGQYVGITPYMGQLIAGEYNYSLNMDLHHTHNGAFTLNSGETLTLPEAKLITRYGILNITSNPSNAEIFINGTNRGTTPLRDFRIESGTHNIELRMSEYHNHQEEFSIEDGETKNIDFILQPAFAGLTVNSSPEQGAKVIIDGREVGLTPYNNPRQPSGTYNIRVEKELWAPSSRQVTVRDNQPVSENFVMPPNHGTLRVTSDNADIFLDNRNVGKNFYQARLVPGRYTLTAKKDRHHDAEQIVVLQVAKTEEIQLEPQPKLGAVSVMTQPFEARGAEIFINQVKQKETTPAVIPLLIGNYEVSVRHKDFLESGRAVNIREGMTENIDFSLQTYQGSMLEKANFWNKHKWVGFTMAVVVAGAGYYCDITATNYYDDYQNAQDTNEAKDFRQKTEDFDNYRDYAYYGASGFAIYGVYSWVKSAIYKSRS